MFGHRTIIICIHGVLQKNIYGLQQRHCYASKLWSITIHNSLGCCEDVQSGPLTNFDKFVYCVKLTGKSSVNWHTQYYRLWNEHAENVVGDDNFHLGVDYTTWYHQHGHLFTTLEVAAHMYQVIILAFSIPLH